MTNSFNGLDGAQELLIKLVEQSPEDWETRKNVVKVLFDAGFYRDASKMVWSAPEIPPVGKEVVFAARIVSKGQPTRAMRLFDTVIEKNMAHPEENLAMAKLLIKAGMPHQAIRFYGAATVMDYGLIDEQFEIALVGADADEKNWSAIVAEDEFPWDGPEIPSEEIATSEEPKKDNSHAELLNGATQPVPMKAPVREKVERQKELPTWRVETKKTSFVAADLLKEDTTFSAQEIEPKLPEVVPEPLTIEQLEAVLPPVTPAPVIAPEIKPAAAALEPDKPVAPPIVEPVSAPVADQPKVVPPAMNIPEPAVSVEAKTEVEVEVTPIPNNDAEFKSRDLGSDGTFFKSYDDAHTHLHTETKAEVSSVPVVPSVDRNDAQELELAKVEPKPTVEGTPKEDTSLVDHVADTMALMDEREDEKSDSQIKVMAERMTGAFSSLMKKMRRKPAENEEPIINVENLDLSGVDEVANGQTETLNSDKPVAETASVNVDSVSAALPREAVPVEAPQSVENKAVSQENGPQLNGNADLNVAPAIPAPSPGPVPMTQIAHAAKAVDKPDIDKPSVPKELDGRTQLVSLAPEDGAGFFNQLQARYSNIGTDLPRPAVLARDMANVDYVGLINKACDKDLDSFSKLLGLHRVMSNGQCNEWIEDMNLLRKGYGDAVLATVVSKYSVTECREILNSVYSSPAPQAAAV